MSVFRYMKTSDLKVCLQKVEYDLYIIPGHENVLINWYVNMF